MKVLITGANGQLGRELQNTAPPNVRVVAMNSSQLDICITDAVHKEVASLGAEVVINAAAYTAVDRAEQEKERAYAVNAVGPANIAAAVQNVGARFIHVSTDFVFDGHRSSPYRPEDPPAPLGVYGESKLAGEKRILATLPKDRALIIRTAWVYSRYGGNFVLTMLRLMRERDRIGVVADQVGTPTWANGLAHVIWTALDKGLQGIHHWTDAGVASWYDFAVAIQEEALALGLLDRNIPIKPINTTDYPTPARRPSYSVLDKTVTWEALDKTADHWRESLRKMLAGLRS